MNKKETRKIVNFLGGAKIGKDRGCFPFATLFISKYKITLHFNLDTYKLLAHQVVYLKTNKSEIIIKHTIKNYPSNIIFICNNENQKNKIIKEFRKIGFICSGDISDIIGKRENIFKLNTIIFFVVVSVFLGLINIISILSKYSINIRNYIPSCIEITSFFLLILSLVIIRFIPYIQNLIIKQGRSFQEIKSSFTLLIEFTILIFSVLTTQFIRQESLNSYSTQVSSKVGIYIFVIIVIMPIIRAKLLGGK